MTLSKVVLEDSLVTSLCAQSFFFFSNLGVQFPQCCLEQLCLVLKRFKIFYFGHFFLHLLSLLIKIGRATHYAPCVVYESQLAFL